MTRTDVSVEAQIATPTRQPLKAKRLAFFRSWPGFMVLSRGVLGDADGSSNGAVPGIMDAVSDPMAGALSL